MEKTVLYCDVAGCGFKQEADPGNSAAFGEWGQATADNVSYDICPGCVAKLLATGTAGETPAVQIAAPVQQIIVEAQTVEPEAPPEQTPTDQSAPESPTN